MPWRSKTKSESFDYFRERDAIRKQFDDLAEKAGIAAAVDRCGEVLEPDYFEDRHLPPLFTKAHAVEKKSWMHKSFKRTGIVYGK